MHNRFIRNTINLLIVILLMTCSALGTYGQENTYRYDEVFPFIVVTPSDVDSLPPFSDQEFYEHSSRIIFDVNKTDVRFDDPFFDLYYTKLLPYINDRRLQLRRVYVRGAASPEGPYKGNRRLGIGRSRELLSILRKGLRYQYVETSEEVSPVTEDYGYLCIVMREADDPDYSVVQRIYDECQGDELCCKKRLMAAQDGRLWSRLLSDYYPQLRAARFMLWFSEPDAEHAPAAVQRDTVVIQQPPVAEPAAATGAPYICHGHIHIGCIHDRSLYPTAADTLLRHPLLALKTNALFDLATFLNAEVEVPIRSRWSVVAEVVWPWWLQRSHNRWCNEMGAVSLEGRWWFRPWQYHSSFRQWSESRRAPLTHGFVGAYLQAGYYDFQTRKTHPYPEGLSQYEFYRKGKQGEFVSAGFTVGIARYLNRHLRFEASLGLGAAYTEYRTYHIDSNTDIEPDRDHHLWRDEHEGKYNLLGWMNFHDHHPRSNGRHLWVGPTKAKFSIVWLLTKPCRKAPKQKGGAL